MKEEDGWEEERFLIKSLRYVAYLVEENYISANYTRNSLFAIDKCEMWTRNQHDCIEW